MPGYVESWTYPYTHSIYTFSLPSLYVTNIWNGPRAYFNSFSFCLTAVCLTGSDLALHPADTLLPLLSNHHPYRIQTIQKPFPGHKWPCQLQSPSVPPWTHIVLRNECVSPFCRSSGQFVGWIFSWLQDPEIENAGSNYPLAKKGCYSCDMTQMSSAGKFHSHKASSKGSSAVCSFARCSDMNKFGTWLLCWLCSALSAAVWANARGSRHQVSWSLSKVNNVRTNASSKEPSP